MFQGYPGWFDLSQGDESISHRRVYIYKASLEVTDIKQNVNAIREIPRDLGIKRLKAHRLEKSRKTSQKKWLHTHRLPTNCLGFQP